MLKQRVITAVVLSVLILSAVIWAPVWLFSLLVALATLYGVWEWSNFCRFDVRDRALYVAVGAVLILLLEWFATSVLVAQVMLVAGAFWLLALTMVLRYPEGVRWKASTPKLFIGLLVLIPAWLALSEIKALEQGEWLILLLLLLVWGADTGAYFSGKALGKHKLMPKVSPGKTLEGLLGGLLTCVMIALLYAFFRELSLMATVFLVLLAVITAMASVLGDLFESMFKRERGIKDSGTLLPGHGGVLDRIDSLTAAAPVFLLGLMYLPAL
ncbi:phosphatidate cytidylyltransferase [Nitrincola iocasae]|uniref:Phosphatidate cytidylyltransferase n=1 Tax=Nitrincola iocasae TaxID=2614693 RepID=A0A5J6LGI9_9GAMM|nr:phosphatidate cytidylyltransferase [Nitrincola iocasae]QEW07707.1 phosphatidate cytidylyltransferase [Nitrincola iocasae]